MVPEPGPVQQRVVRCVLGIGAIVGVGQAELYSPAVDAGAQAVGSCEAADPCYAAEHLALQGARTSWVGVSFEEENGLPASTVVYQL